MWRRKRSSWERIWRTILLERSEEMRERGRKRSCGRGGAMCAKAWAKRVGKCLGEVESYYAAEVEGEVN